MQNMSKHLHLCHKLERNASYKKLLKKAIVVDYIMKKISQIKRKLIGVLRVTMISTNLLIQICLVKQMTLFMCLQVQKLIPMLVHVTFQLTQI